MQKIDDILEDFEDSRGDEMRPNTQTHNPFQRTPEQERRVEIIQSPAGYFQWLGRGRGAEWRWMNWQRRYESTAELHVDENPNRWIGGDE